MRLSRKRNFRSWTPETSRLAHLAKQRKKLEEPTEEIRRPEVGRLLHTIHITDELTGSSFEIKICQATRLNQVTAETFGRRSKPVGMDKIMRRLRQRCVVRWMQQ